MVRFHKIMELCPHSETNSLIVVCSLCSCLFGSQLVFIIFENSLYCMELRCSKIMINTFKSYILDVRLLNLNLNILAKYDIVLRFRLSYLDIRSIC